MKIFVKELTGKIAEYDINSRTKTIDLKNMIADVRGIPPPQQKIIFHGKQLEDDIELSYYRIQNEDMLHLVLNLKG